MKQPLYEKWYNVELGIAHQLARSGGRRLGIENEYEQTNQSSKAIFILLAWKF